MLKNLPITSLGAFTRHSLTQESDLLGLNLRASLSSGLRGALVGNVEGGSRAKSGCQFLYFSLWFHHRQAAAFSWKPQCPSGGSSCIVVLCFWDPWLDPFLTPEGLGVKYPCYYCLWGTALFLVVSLHLVCNCVTSSSMKLCHLFPFSTLTDTLVKNQCSGPSDCTGKARTF